MPKAEIKDATCVSTNENLTLEPEQRVINAAATVGSGPKIGEQDNFLPASYVVPAINIEHKEGPATVVKGIIRTDR